MPAVDGDLVEFADAAVGDVEVGGGVEPGGAEEDIFTIGGEGPGDVVIGVEGEAFGCSPGGGDAEDVVISVAVGGEGDPLAVARPDGVVFPGDVLGELGGFAAGAGDGVEVGPVGENDGIAIRRDGGIAEPKRGFGVEETKGGEQEEKNSHAPSLVKNRSGQTLKSSYSQFIA